MEECVGIDRHWYFASSARNTISVHHASISCRLIYRKLGRQACGEKLVCLPLTGPMEGSGYGHCTAPATPANATANGTDGGAARAYFVRNRRTADGRQCRLPLVYNGNLLLDCTSKGADGQERCFPRDGPPQARPTSSSSSAYKLGFAGDAWPPAAGLHILGRG